VVETERFWLAVYRLPHYGFEEFLKNLSLLDDLYSCIVNDDSRALTALVKRVGANGQVVNMPYMPREGDVWFKHRSGEL